MLPILSFAFQVGKTIYQENETSNYRESVEEQLNHQTNILTEVQDTMNEQSLILAGLQTSMGVLGVASIASLGTSVFSLYKINQVSKELKEVSHKIDSGFIDMKYFISKEVSELINYQQKVKLSEAYEYYQKAVQNLQRSLTISNPDLRKHSFLNSMAYLDKALIIYDSQKKFQDLSPAGHLRQLEIIMIIESFKSELYIIMGENSTGKDHYSDLYKRVNKELLEISSFACRDTIDLILLDTYILKNNDLKVIENKLS